jgi:heme/copper-type cytochrome/quinol oxidase subunit 2
MKTCRSFRRLITAALVAVVLGFAPAAAEACPTCKDAIAQNDPKHQQMVKGYFYSILFMMSMPFVVLGTFGSMAYFSIKRARRVEEDAHDPPSSHMDRRESYDPE